MPAELTALQTKIIDRQAAAVPTVTTVATAAAATHEQSTSFVSIDDLYRDGRAQRRFADRIAAVLHTN